LDIHLLILKVLILKVLNINEDERTQYENSKKVLDRLLKKNKDLVKLVSAGSLDPAGVKKANKQTRDAMFNKLDCYIHIVYTIYGKDSLEAYERCSETSYVQHGQSWNKYNKKTG
jgi:hypothetical protein